MDLQAIRKLNNLGQQNVADVLGISISTYCKIEKGQIQLTVDRLVKLAELFNMSPDELIYSDSGQKKNVLDQDVNITYISGAKMLSDDVSLQNTVRFFLPFFYERDLFVILMDTDNMSPTLRSGDYVIIRKTNLDTTLRWGEPYLIVTDDDQQIRRLLKKQEDAKILVKQDNSTNGIQEYEISYSDITSIWEVRGVISKNLALRGIK